MRDVPWKYARLILFFLVGVIAAMRLCTYYEPNDRDIGCYQVMAHAMLNGGRLFDGALMDQKPPGVHCTWAFGQMVAGYGPGSTYFLNVLAASTTLIGVFLAGRLANGSNRTGLWAAAFWTVASGHLQLDCNQPNTEVFINAFTILGFGLFAGIRGDGRQLRRLLLAGACFAAASLYKHVVVIVPFFLCCINLVLPPEGRSRKQALGDMLIVGGVGAAVWGAMVSYFAATGRFQNLLMGLVLFNKYYTSTAADSTGLVDNILHSLHFAQLLPNWLYFSIPLILLGITGIVLALVAKKPRPWVLLIGLAIGTHLEVALPGRFFAHYYQLWFPFLLIGSAWGLAALEMFTRINRKVIHGAAAAILVMLIVIEAPDYTLSAGDWSRKKHGDVFLRAENLAHLINSILLPNETFFQLGPETELYLDTGRSCPSIIGDYGMNSGPLAAQMTKLLMDDCAKSPPDLFILVRYSEVGKSHPIYKWVLANYVPAPHLVDQDPFFLFVRKGSALERRLAMAAK
ncbi:MAG: hypothetical protein WCD79_12875 [Chthoniobacteraceae bacterium]